MYDSLLNLTSGLVTVSAAATATNAAVALFKPTTTSQVNIGGTPRRGLKARVRVTSCTGTQQTVDFKIQHSDDNSNWADLAVPLGSGTTSTAAVATLTNAAGAKVLFAPFETSKPYVRLQHIVTGTAVAVVYSAEIGIARPG
jgi:hypothetical protein